MLDRKRTAILLLATLVLFAVGCGGGGGKTDLSTRVIDIVATTGMVGDAVQQVGGERVKVNTLMGPGVDPHYYKASASDVTSMANADAVFYNGLHLEGRMVELFEKIKRDGKPTCAIAEAVPEEKLITTDNAHDPHIWFDVELWKLAVEETRRALTDLDPKHGDRYQTNADAFQKELDALHAFIRERSAEVAEERRVLITAHDAFSYFGRQYGYELKSLQGISTVSEASTADVQNLASFIAERKINAVFVESSVPVRNVQAVQAAAKSKGHPVRIGGELFSDALGAPDTDEGTYLGMVRHNVNTIVDALQ
ncbi:manganese transporter [bacterium]|nr:manganese transporter [bacterium]